MSANFFSAKPSYECKLMPVSANHEQSKIKEFVAKVTSQHVSRIEYPKY